MFTFKLFWCFHQIRVKYFPSLTQRISCVAFLLNAHLCLSPLEQRWAMQGFKEVDVAGNVPQSSQLPAIAPTTQSTRKTLLFQRHIPYYENILIQDGFTFCIHWALSCGRLLCTQCWRIQWLRRAQPEGTFLHMEDMKWCSSSSW